MMAFSPSPCSRSFCIQYSKLDATKTIGTHGKINAIWWHIKLKCTKIGGYVGIWIANKFAKFHAQKLNRRENIPKSFREWGLLFLNTLYIGYHFSSGWNTRSVCWSTSASIKQLHYVWLRCAFLSQQPTTDVTSTLQHTATTNHEPYWQDTQEVSLCLVRCCGTHCHWSTVMYHWHSLSPAHDWRLFKRLTLR